MWGWVWAVAVATAAARARAWRGWAWVLRVAGAVGVAGARKKSAMPPLLGQHRQGRRGRPTRDRALLTPWAPPLPLRITHRPNYNRSPQPSPWPPVKAESPPLMSRCICMCLGGCLGGRPGAECLGGVGGRQEAESKGPPQGGVLGLPCQVAWLTTPSWRKLTMSAPFLPGCLSMLLPPLDSSPLGIGVRMRPTPRAPPALPHFSISMLGLHRGCLSLLTMQVKHLVFLRAWLWSTALLETTPSWLEALGLSSSESPCNYCSNCTDICSCHVQNLV